MSIVLGNLKNNQYVKFRAKVIPSGNATAVEVPTDVINALDSGHRPLIAVTVKGHTWRTRVALMRGKYLVGLSAATRAASDIGKGDIVDVELKLDTAPRTVPEPGDLAKALNAHAEVRTRFNRLPYGLRRKEVASVEDAKSPETRQRRIIKLVERMRSARV
jgi:hypothetical protein